MTSKHPKELVDKLQAMLAHNIDATRFVLAYGELTEIADDLVDDPANHIENTMKLTAIVSQLFTSNYWLKNGPALVMVELLNNLTFFDVVKWEKSSEEWQRRDAKALSHCAYNMLFAVLILECGLEATRKISLEFRESAHKHHLHDIPETIKELTPKEVTEL